MKVENYKIELDFDLENKIYRGKEEILVSLDNEKELKIDSVDLKIFEVKVNNQKADFEIDKDKIFIKSNLISGENKIFIDFQGDLKEVLGGIYLSKYKENDEQKYLITTQFEPIEARKAFPCFDDPDRKATFDLVLIFDKNLKAISNTLPVKEEIVGNKNKVIFARSPKMSTYLLYIGVGDWIFVEDKYKDILIRVAVVGKEKVAGTKFALENAKKFLNYLENYFGYPYPLKKLDLIAIPDFAAGAMENWGAVTFRENLLLVFEGITPLANQERVAEVIAHELVHMWFGNLVTMKWWDDLWLNESFATYLAYKTVNNFYPEWKILDKYVSNEVISALNADGLVYSHPIKVEIKDPNESTEIFDEISYEKGGSVLRMLENYLGEDKFREGLRNYIQKFAYQNAKAEDLWQSLAELDSEKGAVNQIMQDFIEKVNYPLISLKKNGDNYYLTQEAFLFLQDRQDCWHIPIIKETDGKLEKTIFAKEKEEIEFDKYVILNKNFTGFYLVDYPQDVLRNNLEEIKNELDLLHLINDYHFLVKKGKKDLDNYLNFISELLTNEELFRGKYLVLSQLISILSYYYFFSKEQRIADILERISMKVIDMLVLEPQNGEFPYQTTLRQKALISLGEVKNTKILNWSKEKFEEFLQNKQSLHSDIKQAVFINSLVGYPDYLDSILDYFQKTLFIEEQNKCLLAFGMVQDKDKLSKLLDFVLTDKVRFSQTIFFFASLASNNSFPELVFDWLKENWQKIELRGGGSGKSDFVLIRILKSLIPTIGAFLTEEVLASFLNQGYFARFEKTKSVILEQTEINRRWVAI